MQMLKIKEISTPGYQKVIEVIDAEANLHSFIAIHNCSLGPALGGVRMYPYHSTKDALNDVLLLAKSMTYKSAVAQNGLGGGKSVIICDPRKNKTEAMLLAFGEAVNTLKGQYIAAEDVGSNPEDMLIIKRKTPYVAALPLESSSGDPSRFTARGVFRGMQAVAQKLWKNPSLRGKRIAIQGLGHVGSKLAEILFWEGAELIFNDIDRNQAHHLAQLYGAKVVDGAEILRTPCDIFSPCALGGSINNSSISKFQCRAIAGCANNQLANPQLGVRLVELGILYAPDSIINAGGIINAAAEFEPGGYDPGVARDKTDLIYDRLLTLFEKAEREHKSTSQVADEMAEYNLLHGIGRRKVPIKFKTEI